jgi:predicted dehydrogenase
MRRHAGLAVVGLGRVGRLHARNLAQCVPSAWLAAVADPVDERARSVGERYGVDWTAGADEAIDNPRVEGVVIAAPTSAHAELVERAAAARKPVLCEKPLGPDPRSARRAAAAAAAAGVPLLVGFQRRFDPDWCALKRIVESGRLGTLELVRMSHRGPEPPSASAPLGDVLVDVAVHDLDAARWLGGEVAEVSAHRAGAEAAVIVLRFETGALGVIDVSRAASYGFDCSAELVGSDATARTGHAYRLHDVEVTEDLRSSAPLARDHAERHRVAYVRELEHFARLVAGGDCAGATGADAVAALELALAAARHDGA